MSWAKLFLSKLRLYWPVGLIYVLVGMYLISPTITRNVAAEHVEVALVQAQAHRAISPTINRYTGHPTRMQIDRIGVDLLIRTGTYDPISQAWTLDDSHLFVNTLIDPDPVISTEKSEQPQKVLFYGHHTSAVLGKTDDLVFGDILVITTAEGQVFSYYYVGDETVNPNDTVILKKERESTPVALLTCDGAWDQFRRIMYFAPLGVDSPKNITNERAV